MSLKTIYHQYLKPPSTNYSFKEPPDFYGLLKENSLVIDIGSKNSRGYSEGRLPKGSKLVCVDIEDGPGVDLVADAHDLHMIKDNTVDCVVTISTLEHVRYPQKIVKEIYRILKPGGIVYVSVPFVFVFHSDPDDHYRFSVDGVRILCEDFECVEAGFNRGPASTTAPVLVHFFAILFSFNNRRIYGLNVDIFTWLLFWMKYLDKWLGKYEMAKVIHAAAYYVGRKPARRAVGM